MFYKRSLTVPNRLLIERPDKRTMVPPTTESVMKRSPRKDPVSGDIIQNPYGRHTVLTVVDGIVHYMDEGVKDYVPLEKWRKWYVGDKKSKVVKAVGV